MSEPDYNGIQIFEALADVLVNEDVPDRIKTHILAATMDMIGVPMFSLERYRDDPAIVALFRSRGVRFVTDDSESTNVEYEALAFPGLPGDRWRDPDGDVWVLCDDGLMRQTRKPTVPEDAQHHFGRMTRMGSV